MAYHELAIFFEMKKSEGKTYVAKAWECFMKTCRPEMIASSHLFHGEVAGLLPGRDQVYCIAVRNENPDAIKYLKDVFASSQDKCLAPPLDRVRESGIIQEFGLKYHGRVDSKGRLKTKKWSRTTHSLCVTTGWPYIPASHPENLQPEILADLERMKKPGFRTPAPAVSEASEAKKDDRKLTLKLKVPPILKRGIWYIGIVFLAAILVTAWATRGKYLGPYLQKRHERKVQRILGPDGYAAYEKKFSLVNIPIVPPELPLDELNKVLGKKGYFVLQCPDESFVNATMQCALHSVDGRGPQDKTRVRVTFKMRTVNGVEFWTPRSIEGAAARREAVAEPERKREAVVAAIKKIDLLYLPDGRILREGGHVIAKVENDKRIQAVQNKQKQKREEKFVWSDMEQRMSGQWMMSTSILLKSGQRMDVIVLRRTAQVLNVMTDKERRMIPLPDVERMEPYDETRYAECIGKILAPARERLTKEWERRVCDRYISEMSAKFVKYGPVFPEAQVIRLEPRNAAGELRARVQVGEIEQELKVGDKISGFRVIDMDRKTKTVLLQWGEGGDVLRIWPQVGM